MSLQRDGGSHSDIKFEQGAEVEPADEGANVGAHPEWGREGGGGGREAKGPDDVVAEVEQEVHPEKIDDPLDEVA